MVVIGMMETNGQSVQLIVLFDQSWIDWGVVIGLINILIIRMVVLFVSLLRGVYERSQIHFPLCPLWGIVL